jgi:hypothetical protein
MLAHRSNQQNVMTQDYFVVIFRAVKIEYYVCNQPRSIMQNLQNILDVEFLMITHIITYQNTHKLKDSSDYDELVFCSLSFDMMRSQTIGIKHNRCICPQNPSLLNNRVIKKMIILLHNSFQHVNKLAEHSSISFIANLDLLRKLVHMQNRLFVAEKFFNAVVRRLKEDYKYFIDFNSQFVEDLELFLIVFPVILVSYNIYHKDIPFLRRLVEPFNH